MISRTICLCFLLFSLFIIGSQARSEDRGQSVEKKIIELVNQARVKGARCGEQYYKATRPLKWNDKLGAAALRHSADMAMRGDMGHSGFDGSSPAERIDGLGYRWIAYGENAGEGYRNPEEAVKGWLRSPEHCRNIMNSGFLEAGAASAREFGVTYWTLLLAAPKTTSFISQ